MRAIYSYINIMHLQPDLFSQASYDESLEMEVEVEARDRKAWRLKVESWGSWGSDDSEDEVDSNEDLMKEEDSAEERRRAEQRTRRRRFNLKRLIRVLHICRPPNHVMAILGKR